jgi:hypothetical protein
MIPNAQFDAASLAVWTTTGNLPEPGASVAAEAMQLASRSQDLSELLSEFPHGDAQRSRLLWLISSVWHEKRHFFDTCLTNYGARRFRDLFTLAANLSPLLAEAQAKQEPVWFPVEVYGSPVSRRLLKISEPPGNILQIANLARTIKDFSAQLDAPSASGDHLFYLGGEAQLEGLGQATQVLSVEYTFGAEDSLAVSAKYVHPMAPEGPYRSIEAVAGVLGCGHDDGKGAIALNLNLASALFITALCGRFFGAGAQPAADLLAPTARLSRLIVELGPTPGRYEMSAEEAAELADKVAKRLWGRTAFEEIAADIDAMEVNVDAAQDTWLSMEGLYDAYKDFVSLRRRVLARAKNLGPASVLPRAFPIFWRDRLKPWQVVATPGGESRAEGAPIVFGQRLNVPPGLEMLVPKSVTWGRLYAAEESDSDDVFAPRAHDAWLQVLERHAPGAFLMLNGRRHRRMVPPELERRIAEIQRYGIPVRFHPQFEWPEQRDRQSRIGEAIALAEFSGRTSLVCDITGDEIKPSEAATLTPWEFRRSPLLPKFREAGIVAEVRLVTDWSDWIVRRDLLEDSTL